MRWSFVVMCACGGTGPPQVATHAQLPPAPAVASKATIVLADGVIACNDTRVHLPPSLAITTASERAVVAASPGGVIWVARSDDGLAADLLQTWTTLHVQLEGALAFGTQLESRLSYSDGTLVVDYAMPHSARLRFAYRRTSECTFAAIERAAEPVGAVTAIGGVTQMTWEPVTDLMKAAAEYECWSNPRARC